MTTSRASKVNKPKVWMRKSDGQLVEYFPTCLGGYAITWVDLSDEKYAHTPVTKDSPLLFDDDERFSQEDYVSLGEL